MKIPAVGLALLIVLQMMPQTATVIPLFQIFSDWWLLDSTFGVVLADSALLVPFATLLLRPFFRAVPPQLEEAGAIDGASILRTFFGGFMRTSRRARCRTGWQRPKFRCEAGRGRTRETTVK